MRVAYLGPPGTVSDEALTAAAPDAEAVPLATLRDVVLSVQEGRIERALVPVENALEGGVDPVLDALALEAPDVALTGEVIQPVSYCLAAGPRAGARGDHDGPLAPAGARPVQGLAAGQPPERGASSRPPRRPTPCATSPQDAHRHASPRSARGSPPAATAR